jgi:hypothetical protein
VSFRSFCVFNISTVKRTHFVAVHVRKPAALSTCHITRFRLSERNYDALFNLKQTDCSVCQAAERRTQAPAFRKICTRRQMDADSFEALLGLGNTNAALLLRLLLYNLLRHYLRAYTQQDNRNIRARPHTLAHKAAYTIAQGRIH